jgi:hypothetical protein
MPNALSGTVHVVHVRLRAVGEQVTAEARDLLVSSVGRGGQSERSLRVEVIVVSRHLASCGVAALAWDER